MGPAGEEGRSNEGEHQLDASHFEQRESHDPHDSRVSAHAEHDLGHVLHVNTDEGVVREECCSSTSGIVCEELKGSEAVTEVDSGTTDLGTLQGEAPEPNLCLVDAIVDVPREGDVKGDETVKELNSCDGDLKIDVVVPAENSSISACETAPLIDKESSMCVVQESLQDEASVPELRLDDYSQQVPGDEDVKEDAACGWALVTNKRKKKKAIMNANKEELKVEGEAMVP